VDKLCIRVKVTECACAVRPGLFFLQETPVENTVFENRLETDFGFPRMRGSGVLANLKKRRLLSPKRSPCGSGCVCRASGYVMPEPYGARRGLLGVYNLITRRSGW